MLKKNVLKSKVLNYKSKNLNLIEQVKILKQLKN